MCAEFSAGLPRSFCLRTSIPDTQECSVFISPPIHFHIFQGWGDAHGKDKTKLGEYVYDHEGTALQNFPVQVTFYIFRSRKFFVFQNHCTLHSANSKTSTLCHT